MLTRDSPQTMFQILSVLVLYLLACFTEQLRKFPTKCVSAHKGFLGLRLNSLGECLCELQSGSCSNHAWKADTQELPSVCSSYSPQRPRDAHSAAERHRPSLPPPELPLLHVQLAAFKRIKLWWPREPVLGLRIPWRLEWSNCSWSSPKPASIGEISISHSLGTLDKETFSTLPLPGQE